MMSDVDVIREKTKRRMKSILSSAATRENIIEALNGALATEIVCVLRYKRHYYAVGGLEVGLAKQEFWEHAKEEQEHADLLAKRIVELGGKPNLNPNGILNRSHSEYVEGDNTVDMIKSDLLAELTAIETYAKMIEWLEANGDHTTKVMIEDILKVEEKHANDMIKLLS